MIRLDAVTLKQMRALQAITDTGSMTAAAARLGLTPPAIHSQIKNLEAAFETPLLARGADQAESGLTPQGAAVVDAMRRIEVILSQCGGQVASLARGEAGEVTLGVVSTAKYFAPLLVRQLAAICPQIRVTLQIGNRDDIIGRLARHSVDLAIMGRPPRVPLLQATPIGPHPHGIVAAPDHPLAGRGPLSGGDLLAHTFLSREEGSGTRILMTRYLDNLGEGVMPAMVEFGSNETIKQAVIAGLGIAFLSLHTVTNELRFGTLVQLGAPQLPIVRHWFLVYPQDARIGQAAQHLHGAILDLAGSYLPEVPAA
ncbi:MAG: LysR family transcriptional regulator [Rhodobacterales bacterium]|nr:LysR family transcriptional regulator [Rhodobacterales bacterium]